MGDDGIGDYSPEAKRAHFYAFWKAGPHTSSPVTQIPIWLIELILNLKHEACPVLP
jgi:hypothetical protein